MENQLDNLSNSVAFFVLKDRNGIVNLLQQNQLVFDEPHTSNERLVTMMINSLFENEDFKNQYLNYVNGKVVEKQTFSNYGENVFSTTPLPTFNPGSNSSPASSGGGGGFMGGFNVGSAISLVNTGLNFFGSSQASKDQRAIAESNAQATLAAAQANASNNATALEIAKLNLAAASAQPAKSNNTTLYVVLAIGGVAVLGGIIFAVSRK